MQILWVVNTVFPKLSSLLDIEPAIGGGWMYGLLDNLSKINNIEFTVVTFYNSKELIHHRIDDVNYFLIPSKNPTKLNINYKNYWSDIFKIINPDLVHIHGSEYTLGLSCILNFPKLKYALSIQGLLSEYYKFYTNGLMIRDILFNPTLRDLIRGNIFNERRIFKKRGELEILYLKNVNNVIGRTKWDKTHTLKHNPNLVYHFNNECLRSPFYNSKKWDADKKEDFTIFISQASYPIKGLHLLIEAVNLLKFEFPSIKIRIGGENILMSIILKDKLKMKGYASIIRKKLIKYELLNNFEFCGPLNSENIVEEFLRAHIFVCPSSIENSPNSLGEAQILGVPSISSFVGGIPDMVINNFDGLLYRHEDYFMLSALIKELFLNTDLCIKISKNSITTASLRHDLEVNSNQTLNIYKQIIGHIN
jgi:glycosyltransferase involved in cell wall biosynthesis